MSSTANYPEGVSVIIVSYNVRDVLASCLDSVLHSAKSLNRNFEIIIVDNHSRDDTVKLLKPRYQDITWIELEHNMGFGTACNRGADAASYSLLLFLNPDTIIEKNTLEVMWNLFRQKDDAGVAGCKIKNPDNTLQLACRRSFPTPRIAGYRFLGLSHLFPKSKTYGRYNLTYLDENQEQEVDAVSGSFLCIEKKLFVEVGGFDEEFFMYGEDLDLCYRVKLKGKRNWYTPDTNILHFKGESAKSRPLRSLFHFYSAMIIFSKKHFELRMLPLALFYFGICILAVFNFLHNRWKKWQRWNIDLVLVNGILALVTLIYSNYKGVAHIILGHPFLYLTWHGLLSFLFLFFLGYGGDYGKAVPNLKTSFISASLAVLSFFAIGYFFYEESFSRIVLGISGLFSFGCVTGWRALANKGSQFLGRMTASRKRMVIVGINSRSYKIRDFILQDLIQGYEFLGFIPEPGSDISQEMRSEIICDFSALFSILKKLEIHEIIIALEKDAYQTALQILSMKKDTRASVKILLGEPKPRSITLVDLNYIR
jgi:GT2 family glycosyltransferase